MRCACSVAWERHDPIVEVPLPNETEPHAHSSLIAHIVTMFGGLSFERTPILGDCTQAQLSDRTQAALHARRSGPA